MGIFARNPYRYQKRINLVAWVLQLLICVVVLALFAYVLSLTNQYDFNDYMDDVGYDQSIDWDHILTAGAGTRIALSCAVICLNIAEIVLVTKDRMHPGVYLGSACVKVTIFGILFIADLVALDWLGVIIDGICLGTSLSQLVYGARLIHYKRKGMLIRPVDDLNHQGGPGGVGGGPAYAPTYNGHMDTEMGPMAPGGSAYNPPAYSQGYSYGGGEYRGAAAAPGHGGDAAPTGKSTAENSPPGSVSAQQQPQGGYGRMYG